MRRTKEEKQRRHWISKCRKLADDHDWENSLIHGSLKKTQNGKCGKFG